MLRKHAHGAARFLLTGAQSALGTVHHKEDFWRLVSAWRALRGIFLFSLLFYEEAGVLSLANLERILTTSKAEKGRHQQIHHFAFGASSGKGHVLLRR